MPHIKNMKEKTLRYPGHVEYIRVIKDSGFFSEDKIEVQGNLISPLEFTSKIEMTGLDFSEAIEDCSVVADSCSFVSAAVNSVCTCIIYLLITSHFFFFEKGFDSIIFTLSPILNLFFSS